jgi:hypothetical protein
VTKPLYARSSPPVFCLCGSTAPGGLQRQVDDFSRQKLLILQLDDPHGITTDGFGRAFKQLTHDAHRFWQAGVGPRLEHPVPRR